MEIDFTVKEDKIDSDFKRIASDLMNNWLIKIESALYRITEIEFYLNSETHNDVYTHKHQLQTHMGKWYLHGSGIDITFGSETHYGGILIRAIYDINSKKYIYGPLNCVTELFSNIKNIYETKLSFGFVPEKGYNLIEETPIAAPRVGLNPPKDEEKYNAFYRFLIMPKRKHAEKTRIADGMKQQEYSKNDINNIWG